MDTAEKKKKIQEIEFMLNEYERVEYNLNKLWEEQAQIKSAIIQRIIEVSGHQDEVDKLRSFIGKKVMITDSDMDVEIINVKDIIFDKWDVRLKGEGVQTNGNSIYKSYGATIKLGNLEQAIYNMNVVDRNVPEQILSQMEDQKNTRIKEVVSKIEEQHKKDIETFKKYLNAEIKDDDLKDRCLHSHDEDRLDEIARISIGQLKKMALGVPDPNEKYDVISD